MLSVLVVSFNGQDKRQKQEQGEGGHAEARGRAEGDSKLLLEE